MKQMPRLKRMKTIRLLGHIWPSGCITISPVRELKESHHDCFDLRVQDETEEIEILNIIRSIGKKTVVYDLSKGAPLSCAGFEKQEKLALGDVWEQFPGKADSSMLEDWI